MTQQRPSPRLAQLKLLWIVLWAAVLVPLFVVVARRVLYFHPVVTLSSLTTWFQGRGRAPLVDFRQITLEQLETDGALVMTNGTRWQSSSRGAEVVPERHPPVWGSVELEVPPFSVFEQEILVELQPAPEGLWVELTLMEQDGDMWHLPSRRLPAGTRELSVSVAQLEYRGSTSRPQGLMDIHRLYLCLQPRAVVAAGSVVVERISIAPITLPEVLVVPAPVADEERFRNRHPVQPPDGAFRVTLLGDSMVYGSGLGLDSGEHDRIFSALLEGSLRTERAGVQVLNFSVPGFNTELEVALYEETVRAYEPDLVLLFWFSNDDEDVLENRRTRERLRGSDKYAQLYTAVQDEDLLQRLITQEAGVLSENRHSMALAIESMDQLERLAAEDGIPVALVVFYDTPERQLTVLRELCEAKGWPLLELDGLLSRYGPRRIYVQAEQAPYDSHPSLFGHEVIAETITDFLLDSELIPRD
jgi:hypothetical protein